MVNHEIGRLPVVRRSNPQELIGIVTRSDVLSAFRHRMKDSETQKPNLRLLPSPAAFAAK